MSLNMKQVSSHHRSRERNQPARIFVHPAPSQKGRHKIVSLNAAYALITTKNIFSFLEEGNQNLDQTQYKNKLFSPLPSLLPFQVVYTCPLKLVINSNNKYIFIIHNKANDKPFLSDLSLVCIYSKVSGITSCRKTISAFSSSIILK